VGCLLGRSWRPRSAEQRAGPVWRRDGGAPMAHARGLAGLPARAARGQVGRRPTRPRRTASWSAGSCNRR
jgi:hypothetical protein